MELDMIHHVAMNVADYEQTKEFYVNRLGFRILGEYGFPSGTLRLDCSRGNCRLEIFHSPRYEPLPERPAVGYRHLCFRVENIHDTVAWLRERGVETEPVRPDPMAGGLMTFFRDPNGLELELHE